MNRNKNQRWKRVPIDEGLIAKGIPQDLIGIEELHDYTLVKKNGRTGKVSIKLTQDPPTKKRKRKELHQQNVETVVKQPQKKKRKLKNITEVQTLLERKTLAISEINDSEPSQLPTDIGSSKEQDPSESNDAFEVTDDMTIWKAMFLPNSILRAIWELGFKVPTPIQLATLPTAMKGRKDIVGAAETGSGKTLAFGIPIIYGILKDKEFEQKQKEKLPNSEEESKSELEDGDEYGDSEDEQESSTEDVTNRDKLKLEFGTHATPSIATKLRALIITPTRELAVQIEKHLKAISKYTNVSMALVIGGMAAPKQERLLKKGPDIVIGTPGRIWELVQCGNPHLTQLSAIRYLALDETDRLLEQGHFAELHTLLEHINKDERSRRWRQNFIFSATLTLRHDLPQRLKKNKKTQAMKLDNLLKLVHVRSKAKVVDLTSEAQNIKPVTLKEMKLYSSSIEDKDYYLYYFLLHNPGRTLVFCNSINNVRRLTSVFTLLQVKPLPLHAQMHQKQRLKHLEQFSENENALLIATDVAARGLDIPDVQHVVHFQVPRSAENYVHRSGRTARASRDGLSLMLIEPGEATLYLQLCKTLHKYKSDLPVYDVNLEALNSAKQRVNLARYIESLEHKTKKSNADHSWIEKMAEEADIIVDHKSRGSQTDDYNRAHLVRHLKMKRKELLQLLTRPLKKKRCFLA